MKNNGKLDWPKNKTKLVFDKESKNREKKGKSRQKIRRYENDGTTGF